MIIKVLRWHCFGGAIDSENWNGLFPCDSSLPDSFDAVIGFNQLDPEFMQFQGPKLFVCGEPLRHLDDFTRDHLWLLPSENLWAYWLGGMEERHFPYGMHNEASLLTYADNIEKSLDQERPKKVALINIRKPSHTRKPEHDLQDLREEIALEFAKREVIVDIWGRGGSWISFCREAPSFLKFHGEADEKIQVLQKFQFTICVENTAFPGYITEKPYHALMSGALPVYAGGKQEEITDYFEEGLILNAYQGAKEVVEQALSMDLSARRRKRAQIVRWFRESPQPRRSLNSSLSLRILQKLEAQL